MKKSLLQSLSVYAFVLVSTLSGCASYQTCGSGKCPGDAEINTQVEEQLAQHPDIESNAIRVQTLDHRVFLSGLVSSGLAIEEATVVARSVPGVSEVSNSIVVSD